MVWPVLEPLSDSGTGKIFLWLLSCPERVAVRALPTLAEVAPPKGGLLATHKPMTLPSYEHRDWFC